MDWFRSKLGLTDAPSVAATAEEEEDNVSVDDLIHSKNVDIQSAQARLKKVNASLASGTAGNVADLLRKQVALEKEVAQYSKELQALEEQKRIVDRAIDAKRRAAAMKQTGSQVGKNVDALKRIDVDSIRDNLDDNISDLKGFTEHMDEPLDRDEANEIDEEVQKRMEELMQRRADEAAANFPSAVVSSSKNNNNNGNDAVKTSTTGRATATAK